MPRQARIDAPGALHHIIIRGIERKKIFKDDSDRDDFLELTQPAVSISVKRGRKIADENGFHLLDE